jgi:hypothetical protein
MGKLVKKYIGQDQVGSVQVELENSEALRGQASDGLSSIDLLELDDSDLLQMLKHPYIPGDAVADLQAVPKQQLDSAIQNFVSKTDYHKEIVTLNSTDITNQYIDLSVKAAINTCQIGVGERVMLWESLDYSTALSGSVTRVSFLGPSATGGSTPLSDGQTLYIQCVID